MLEELNEGIQNYLRTKIDKLFTKGSRPFVQFTYNKNYYFPIALGKLMNSTGIFEANNTKGYHKLFILTLTL